MKDRSNFTFDDYQAEMEREERNAERFGLALRVIFTAGWLMTVIFGAQLTVKAYHGDHWWGAAFWTVCTVCNTYYLFRSVQRLTDPEKEYL